MNDIVEIDDDPEVTIQDEKTVEDEATETERKTEEPNEQEEFSKRVQKRIDKLVYERNIEREEREREREENEKLRQRLEELESRFQANDQAKQQNDIQSEIEGLKARKAILYEEGDFDAAADLDDQIIDLRLKQREAKSEVRQQPKVEQQTVQQSENQVEHKQPAPLPEAQQNWLNNNEWFYNPNNINRAQKAESIFARLLDEGYDANDESLFKELDKRLGNKREQPPPVSAPDRGRATGSSNSVTFTKSDAERLRAWGLNPNDPQVRDEYLAQKRNRHA